jgi:hypothetical protein
VRGLPAATPGAGLEQTGACFVRVNPMLPDRSRLPQTQPRGLAFG